MDRSVPLWWRSGHSHPLGWFSPWQIQYETKIEIHLPSPRALLAATASASAANFVLSSGAGLITPTGRGGAISSFAGWDTFSGNPPAAPDFTSPINDSTPDLPGSAVSGALIVTNNGQDHITGSGNYYSGTGQTNETITVPVVGALAAGFITIIAQGISGPGFGGSFGLFG